MDAGAVRHETRRHAAQVKPTQLLQTARLRISSEKRQLSTGARAHVLYRNGEAKRKRVYN